MAVVKSSSYGQKAQTNTGMIKQHYKPNTTDQVLDRVSGVTEDSLFLAKLDVAESYLIKMKGRKRAKALMQSTRFWNWFNKLWEIHDKNILYNMDEEQWDTCNEVWYEDQQYSKWKMGAWQYVPTQEELAVINL